MDEEKIIIQSEENETAIDIENIELTAGRQETVEYIEVTEPEAITIEFEESFGTTGNSDGVTHSSLPDRNDPNQHVISAIEGLQDILDKLSAIKDTVYAARGGFAEFRPWLKQGYYETEDIYQGTGGVGYFVSLVVANNNLDGNNIYIDICKKINNDSTIAINDVYGVTVANSGFCGYHGDTDNPNYAQVCLLGDVKVRVSAEEHQKINVGDYVVPNELGYASKAENGVGFKVVSRGRIEASWYYVEIALVPQNDNVARVMKELQDTQTNLENVTIQLGGISDTITGVVDSNIQLGKDFTGLRDLVGEATNKIDTQLPAITQMIEDAKKMADDVKLVIQTVQMEYSEAVKKANDAKDAIDGALSDVAELQKNMEQLATWEGEDGSSGIVGFLAQAEKDHTELSSLTSAFGDNGADLTAIIQKIDENGAAIQHLVSHIDKYTLGEHSPAFGLSAEETYILNPGHIYVPTKDHRDEYTYVETPVAFKRGKYYEWAIGDTPEVYTWIERGDVLTSTSIIEGETEGDLWYCWQGILDNDKYVYDPGVLYSWDNTKKIWVAVASVNNNATSRVTGLVRQTAEKLTSAYTDLQGDVSELTQTANEISTIVASVQGNLSQIQQTAGDITLGVYDPTQGATSLEILLGGMGTVSNYGGRICIKHVITESPEISADRYSQPPLWNSEQFVFMDSTLDSAAGAYYFGSDNHREYYKLVTDGYEVYTIGNEAMTLLRTRVDENGSAIEGLAQFDAGLNQNLATIQAQANKNEAKIASVAAGEYVVCSNINLQLTEDDRTKIPTEEYRYKRAPKWQRIDENRMGFQFDANDKDSNGTYYMLADNVKYYYTLLFDADDNIIGYEQYELASTGSASIMQLVTQNGSSIGMIVKNDKVDASVIVEAINDTASSATIKANKINFDGFTTFTNSTDFENLKGETIKSVEVQYASSDSSTVAPTEGWNTTAPTWSDGKYIWQRTVVTYASGTQSTSGATCIQGAKGADGTGVAIKNTAYLNGSVSDDIVGQSFELYSDAECTVKITEISDGDAYLVGGYLFVYAGTDGKFVCVGKIHGPEGSPGRGISKVEEYYLRNNDSVTVPEINDDSWGSQLTAPDAAHKYLWNYEKTFYTDNTKEATTPVIIATYVEDGVGIGSVKNYYLTSDKATEITIEGYQWSEQPGVTDETKKYLWNYEEVYDTDSKVISITEPCVIGVHGERGVDGAGINSVTVEYALSPSLAIPQDDENDTVWKSTITELGEVGEENYVWTRTIIDYTDDRQETVTYTYSKQGKTGTAGTSVKVLKIEYQQGDSATKAPNGPWSLSVVSVEEGKYLWTKTTFTDTSVAYGVAKQGVDGRNGKDGTDGVGVSQVLTFYCLHPYYSSPPATPDIDLKIWDTEQPAWVRGQYIWICNQTTWTNGDITYTEPVLADALNSANETANNALDGIQGVGDYVNWIDERLTFWCAENDQTLIDGGQIYTGSIGASQIAAQAITAEHLAADAIVVGASDIQTDSWTITTATWDSSIAIQYADGGLYYVSNTVLSPDELIGAKVIVSESGQCVEYTIKNVYDNGFAYVWDNNDDSYTFPPIYSVYQTFNDYPCGIYFGAIGGKFVEQLTYTKTLSDLLSKENDITVIDGGKIKTGSITAQQIATEALMSRKYGKPDDSEQSNNIYATNGTFFDLADGSIISKNFAINDDTAYFRGTVYATAGEIGGCQIVNGKLSISGSIVVGSDDVILSDTQLEFKWENAGEGVNFLSTGRMLYPVSDYIFTNPKNELVGATITWSNGESHTITQTDMVELRDVASGKVPVYYVAPTGQDDEQLPNIIFALPGSEVYGLSQGVYFEGNTTIHVASLTASSSTVLSDLFTKDKTTIDGSKITTGSITADQINATNLKVSAANITGTLKAEQIATGALTVGADAVLLDEPTETHIAWTDENGVTTFYDDYTTYKVSDYIIHDINELVGGVITWSNGDSHIIQGYPTDIYNMSNVVGYTIDVWSADKKGNLPSIILVLEGNEEITAGIYFAKHGNDVSSNQVSNVYVTSLTITTTNSLSTLFTPGTTTINGDKIATGTLSADKIKGGTISSSNITLPFWHEQYDGEDVSDTTAIRFFDWSGTTQAGWLYGISYTDLTDDDMSTVKRIVLETTDADYALKINSRSNISVGASQNTYIHGDEVFIGGSYDTTVIKFQIKDKGTYKLKIDQAVNAGILEKIS